MFKRLFPVLQSIESGKFYYVSLAIFFGHSQPLFSLFSFLWFIGTIQWIYSQCLNDRKEEGRVCSIFYALFSLEIARHPGRIDWWHFPKKPSPSQDSNPSCLDRMPSFYRLCHHHCHVSLALKFIRFSARPVTYEAPFPVTTDLFYRNAVNIFSVFTRECTGKMLLDHRAELSQPAIEMTQAYSPCTTVCL